MAEVWPGLHLHTHTTHHTTQHTHTTHTHTPHNTRHTTHSRVQHNTTHGMKKRQSVAQFVSPHLLLGLPSAVFLWSVLLEFLVPGDGVASLLLLDQLPVVLVPGRNTHTQRERNRYTYIVENLLQVYKHTSQPRSLVCGSARTASVQRSFQPATNGIYGILLGFSWIEARGFSKN